MVKLFDRVGRAAAIAALAGCNVAPAPRSVEKQEK